MRSTNVITKEEEEEEKHDEQIVNIYPPPYLIILLFICSVIISAVLFPVYVAPPIEYNSHYRHVSGTVNNTITIQNQCCERINCKCSECNGSCNNTCDFYLNNLQETHECGAESRCCRTQCYSCCMKDCVVLDCNCFCEEGVNSQKCVVTCGNCTRLDTIILFARILQNGDVTTSIHIETKKCGRNDKQCVDSWLNYYNSGKFVDIWYNIYELNTDTHIQDPNLKWNIPAVSFACLFALVALICLLNILNWVCKRKIHE